LDVCRCAAEVSSEKRESVRCRKYEIAPNLYYRWKDEVEQGAKAALGGRSARVKRTLFCPSWRGDLTHCINIFSVTMAYQLQLGLDPQAKFAVPTNKWETDPDRQFI
jgi:hypothetical protein